MSIKIGNGGRISVKRSGGPAKIPAIGSVAGKRIPGFAQAKFPKSVVKSATRRK